MKKAIVLTGKQASGKSWTAIGISNLFSGQTLFLEASTKIKELQLGFISLVVIDQVRDQKAIIKYEPLRAKYPKCAFVFTTLAEVNKMDPEKYHVIECSH